MRKRPSRGGPGSLPVPSDHVRWRQETRRQLEADQAAFWPHTDRSLSLPDRLWWLAQELDDTADAIGPVPELAEKSLRSHARFLEGLVSELREARLRASVPARDQEVQINDELGL